jgi:hypothetical protein
MCKLSDLTKVDSMREKDGLSLKAEPTFNVQFSRNAPRLLTASHTLGHIRLALYRDIFNSYGWGEGSALISIFIRSPSIP